MINEITIKIAFAPATGGEGLEPRVTTLGVPSSEVAAETAGVHIPAPPEISTQETGAYIPAPPEVPEGAAGLHIPALPGVSAEAAGLHIPAPPEVTEPTTEGE